MVVVGWAQRDPAAAAGGHPVQAFVHRKDRRARLDLVHLRVLVRVVGGLGAQDRPQLAEPEAVFLGDEQLCFDGRIVLEVVGAGQPHHPRGVGSGLVAIERLRERAVDLLDLDRCRRLLQGPVGVQVALGAGVDDDRR